jgi:hypothetical protein
MTKSQRALLISILATVALYTIPQLRLIARPLVLLSTLAHELGHGLAAIAMGCSFERLAMFSDASGVAHWSGNPGRLARAVISAGGLMGPAAMAGVLFSVTRSGSAAKATATTMAVALLVIDLLWVRNLFGFGFVLLLSAALFTLVSRTSVETVRTVLLFLACQLALSVFSRGDYLFTDVAKTSAGEMPSDVAHIEAALILPYWVWGGFIGLLSVAILWAGVRPWIRDTLPSGGNPSSSQTGNRARTRQKRRT